MTPQDHGWSSLLVAVALVGAYFTIDGAQPYAVALLVALVPVDVYFRFVRSVPTITPPRCSWPGIRTTSRRTARTRMHVANGGRRHSGGSPSFSRA